MPIARHPYTQALLAEVPRLSYVKAPVRPDQGRDPLADEPAARLPFPHPLPLCRPALLARDPAPAAATARARWPAISKTAASHDAAPCPYRSPTDMKNTDKIWDHVEAHPRFHCPRGSRLRHARDALRRGGILRAHAEMLEAQGFRVTRNIAGIPTAVMGEAGPTAGRSSPSSANTTRCPA